MSVVKTSEMLYSFLPKDKQKFSFSRTQTSGRACDKIKEGEVSRPKRQQLCTVFALYLTLPTVKNVFLFHVPNIKNSLKYFSSSNNVSADWNFCDMNDNKSERLQSKIFHSYSYIACSYIFINGVLIILMILIRISIYLHKTYYIRNIKISIKWKYRKN